MMLLDTSFPRTLTTWMRAYADARGSRIEGWVFEGIEARRAAEQSLASHGVPARFRSAYKPLLHYFLEEVDMRGLQAATVRYPVHPQAAPNRYVLEAYPLAGMLAGVTLTFEAGGPELLAPPPQTATHSETHSRPVPQPCYEVRLRYADGREHTARVFAPGILILDPEGPALSPSGWLRVHGPDGTVQVDQPCRTEYQAVFDAAMACVRGQAWAGDGPYFPRLELRADIPALEFAPGWDEALVSSGEALHEDLYFSLLEHFQRLSGRPPGDRGLQPGQIVPDVRYLPDMRAREARLRISVQDFEPVARLESRLPDGPLHETAGPLPPACIAGLTAALDGAPLAAVSCQGRPLSAVYVAGKDPAVLISAGQHANETSGIVGALRAAQALRGQPGAHFALIACENPDGYALHQRYCAEHPRHMHHAARYSALGDDVAYREHEPRYEQLARIEALRISGAHLHINLHGYPAHEWTRPLSGYLPRLFEDWSIPRGFFLVMRHHAGWARPARELLEGVTARLAQVPGLLAFNQAQAAMYEAHALRPGFDCINGIAVHLAESDRELAPLALLTEFPDETVYGERFRFAHTVQYETVMAAVACYRAIAPALPPRAQDR